MPNNATPLISVIVPVYNAEDYLRYCIDSILQQSYTNLEVILVDDGAKDSSPAICDEYATQDSRVTVIHQENGGIAKAQNTGLDAAHGEYIAFSDNDDILNRRNIEYLLHALQSTGADMSKARWRQFGVSQLGEVSKEAETGAQAPGKITVFEHPLAAYQTVFCKSLRLLGSKLGRNTEARYFNEANWCRLYKRELWDGLRFPEGHYAQDIRMAGPLYARMGKVADIDCVRYYWLQNFQFTLEQGITPCRNYFGLTASVRDEGKGLKALGSEELHDSDWQNHLDDVATMRALISKLSIGERLKCAVLATIRSCENVVYDNRIHSMK